MTYGELRFRICKAFPGIDSDLIDGWIGDVYAEILGQLPWQRRSVQATLQTVAPYATGTVEVTAGSASVTGTGTVWTAAMTGRGFRVTGRDEFYAFTRTGDTAGTLDRPYEGASAAGSDYKIFQRVYPLPANCRLLEDNAFDGLARLDRSQLGATRTEYGTPTVWASSMDDSSTPPLMQVELYPIPDQAIGIPFTYTAEAPALGQTSMTLLPWIQPAALVEGTTAKIKAHLKDYAGADWHAKLALGAVETMRGSEAQGMAPCQIEVGSHYTAHRARRWTR